MVNGYAPKTLAEALDLRGKYDLVLYAGGTDLMVENRPNVIYLFLGKLPELKTIREDAAYIRIGATVTYTEALASDLVPQFMKEAISRIAAPAIRNAGTFGGNLGNGSAKADSVLIEFVTGAKLKLLSAKGERIVDVEKFYLGRKKLDLASDEIIAEILLSKAGINDYYYKKVGGRNALAISRVSFAGILSVENGIITRFSAGFGAVADTVLRFRDVETMLVGGGKGDQAGAAEGLRRKAGADSWPRQCRVPQDRLHESAGRFPDGKGHLSQYKNPLCKQHRGFLYQLMKNVA